MISPIENNGMISRLQDISNLTHNEEHRAVLDHFNTQQTVEKKQERYNHTVSQSEDSTDSDTRHDAKEKGRNEYVNLYQKEKKKSLPKEGKVVQKQRNGFDIKI